MVLVGLPGAGKTTAGRALAEKLGRPFLDFDDEIVRRQGVDVSEIFRERGESAFRALERELTLELKGAEGSVLAPGGGWMEQPGLAGVLRPPSTIVYLSISPAAAVARLGDSVAARPLLSGGSALDAMVRLHARRHLIYSGADAIVEVEHLDLQGVMKELLRLVSPGVPSRWTANDVR